VLWCGSEAAIGTLADQYLVARGLPGLAASPVLRFRADMPHPEHPRLPALVALVQDFAGQPAAIHRTYLGPDGVRANVEPAKASLGPVWGAAIRLQPLAANRPLVIGEGIETAASAGCLMGCPAWAAISAGNLAKGLRLPPEVRHVIIAVDPDDAGRDAGREAWVRWTEEKRTVQIATPEGAGDFNDLWLARGNRRG
jgi:putative DNA primase/helicase